MRVQLDDGREAHVFVRYTEIERTHFVHQSGHQTELRRAAIVQVKFPNGDLVEATAICIPPDPFVKKTGRFLAARKLAAKLRARGTLSAEERGRILRPIFGA